MTKAKEQPSSEDVQPAEEVASDHAHAEFESLAALKEQVESLLGHFVAQEARIAALERVAHSDHTLDPGAINHIVEQATAHAVQHVHKMFGHSGMPARGDQA